ncbi:Rha family transcriptional regulator [Prevotella communis]|uniref:Rha family transcriptional regulator n=1 Tax=Prevotella communis TaxID=2913614 RepID=UPI003570E948
MPTFFSLKQHNHLMRDIRKMEIAWEKVTQSKFGCSTYKDATGRTLPCYVGAILR